ncbi:MAG: type II secretion system F family protein [bacterium]|nr:type II secretion system F family protein [bacterium]
MPNFSYIAKDMQGEYHRGDVVTVDEHHAAELLRRKSLIVISIKAEKKSSGKIWDKYFNRVSFNEVVMMTRQLATMIGAGLVLSEALDILEEQQENPTFKKVLGEVSSSIKGGLDFASALEKHPDVFPNIYSKLVRAGQASGKLDTILINLSENLEKEREFKSRVKGAMVYPVVVMGMMGMVMLIMVFFVMPKLMALYKDSGIELPLPTRIVLAFTGFVGNFWWALAILAIVGTIALKRYQATNEGRLIFDRLLLKAPIVGRIVNLVILTNFTRTFALLVSSGLSILEAIKISAEVVGNRIYKDGLDIAYRGVERGLSFSSQLLILPVFPHIVGQMMKTGEETGKIDEIIFKMADYFESESDHSLKNITTLIEPVVLVILGVGVAFLVISVILPIYQLTTNIK